MYRTNDAYLVIQLIQTSLKLHLSY